MSTVPYVPSGQRTPSPWPASTPLEITFDGTAREISIGDAGCTINCTSDEPVILTARGDVVAKMKVLIVWSGDGQPEVREGEGATLFCGLDQEGALHRKIAYKGGAITLFMTGNPDGVSSRWTIFGMTSP